MGLPAHFRILPLGDGALTVEFGDTVDPDLNARVLALDAALAADPPPGIGETIPTYRALYVQYDPVVIRFADLAAPLRTMARGCKVPSRDRRGWAGPRGFV